MNFKTDILHIGDFINKNTNILIIIGIISIITAIACALITKARKGLLEDVIFSGVFGLLFNVLGLLFVIFRKPVWNNLGWIPVVVAWFFLDGNLIFALMLVAYAILWMFTQHALIEKIKVIEE